jgi:hypothetical protein
LNSEYGSTKWAYNKQGNKANAWVDKKSYSPSETQYQNSNVKYINNIKEDLVKLGFKKTSSYTLTDRITTKYNNIKYTVKLELVSRKDEEEYGNEKNFFLVTITTNPSIEELKKMDLKRRRDSTYAVTFEFTQDEFAEMYPKSRTTVTRETVLRDDFNSNADFLSNVVVGEIVYIFNDKLYNNYCLVYCQNKVGFILKECLKKFDIAQNNNPTAKLENKKVLRNCLNYRYVAILSQTLPEYMWLYSEKTYTEISKRIVELPEGAKLFVIEEATDDNLFSFVCYNGINGYISKNLLIID